jgi:hypothetical protein
VQKYLAHLYVLIRYNCHSFNKRVVFLTQPTRFIKS